MSDELPSPYFEGEDKSDNLSLFTLQIQLAATAIATSFLLILIPNFETISFMAFMLGFMFSIKFAMKTILLMGVSWELFATITFGFSGIIFPFKIIAWLIIGMLGVIARKIHTKYFFEFLVYGILSAVIYDIFVTAPLAFLFLADKSQFLSVLIASFVTGLAFTAAHIIGNSILFSLKPRIYYTIIPQLRNHYPDILKIDGSNFDYLSNFDWNIVYNWGLVKLHKKRFYSTLLVLTLSLLLIASSIVVVINPQILYHKSTSQNNGEINVVFQIHYQGVLPDEEHSLLIFANQSVLDVLVQIAIVNFTCIHSSIPYVCAINNVWEKQNLPNHYWIYYVDQVYASIGASLRYLNNGDTVLWSYQ